MIRILAPSARLLAFDMIAAHHHKVQLPLIAPALRALNRVDPSQTTMIRKAYEAEAVRRWKSVQALVVRSVDTEDVFGLRGLFSLQASSAADVPRLRSNVGTPGPKAFNFPTDRQKVTEFNAWFVKATESNMLELGKVMAGGGLSDIPMSQWQTQFVKRGYSKGSATALARMARRFGGLDPAIISQAVLDSPFHRSRLSDLYTRNFQELKGITDATAQSLRRALTDGLAAGVGPRQLARTLNKGIAGIGIRRARMMARTEIIRANAEATLNTFEQFGVLEVTVQAEFKTTGDERVCPRCESLEGRILTVDEARGLIPVHPNCRCTWIPVLPKSQKPAVVVGPSKVSHFTEAQLLAESKTLGIDLFPLELGGELNLEAVWNKRFTGMSVKKVSRAMGLDKKLFDSRRSIRFGDKRIRFDASSEGTDKMVRFLNFDGKKPGIVAHHSHLRLAATGKGQAKKILANQVAFYEELGVSKVELAANLDVGGYAFARYGFIPRDEWSRLKKFVLKKDSSLEFKYPDIFKSTDPRSIRLLASTPEGKEVLLGSDWFAVLDLIDEESMKVFRNYVGRSVQ